MAFASACDVALAVPNNLRAARAYFNRKHSNINYSGSMRPLNDYYHVKLLDMPKKPGLILTIEKDETQQIRAAEVLAVPKHNDLELQPGALVYIQQYYGQKIHDNELLIKMDYILSEYDDA